VANYWEGILNIGSIMHHSRNFVGTPPSPSLFQKWEKKNQAASNPDGCMLYPQFSLAAKNNNNIIIIIIIKFNFKIIINFNTKRAR
jgi:hypothetical protein